MANKLSSVERIRVETNFTNFRLRATKKKKVADAWIFKTIGNIEGLDDKLKPSQDKCLERQVRI